MKPVFADTGFYVAIHNRRDQLHAVAVELASRLRVPVVTTEFVLIEVANFFKRPGDRALFAEVDRALRSDPATSILPAASHLYASGLDLFASRLDQQWSLVDCTSFQVMQELELTDALTADEHFGTLTPLRLPADKALCPRCPRRIAQHRPPSAAYCRRSGAKRTIEGFSNKQLRRRSLFTRSKIESRLH
jgi:uncharacterized protein